MRFVGATAAVRRANGFEHVRFLCTKQDFDISMELYSFEKEALKRAAGGKNWASSEYGSQYKDLFDVARPIAGPKLGLREVFKPRAGRGEQGDKSLKKEAGNYSRTSANPRIFCDR